MENMNIQCGENSTHSLKKDEFVPINEFVFLKPFEEDTTNNAYFNNLHIPDEIIQNILSFIPPKDLLELTLVCKKWCNIIKTESFWMGIYNRYYPNKAKKLPWYVFYCYFTTNYFKNLLKNGNGQEQLNYWKIAINDGHIIEDPPVGCDPLPSDVSDFNGFTSCFVTTHDKCIKIQEISLRNRRLIRYILNKFKPYIYVSEWVAGRFDCGCDYKLSIIGYGEEYVEGIDFKPNYLYAKGIQRCRKVPLYKPFNFLFHKTSPTYIVKRREGKEWQKVEILVEEYPSNVTVLVFEHEGKGMGEGQGNDFWKGPYGSKMAGGVVRLVFDSIQPLQNN